jgi:hypothetical protein
VPELAEEDFWEIKLSMALVQNSRRGREQRDLGNQQKIK